MEREPRGFLTRDDRDDDPVISPQPCAQSGALRVLRGTVVGLTAVTLGAGGHGLASGMLPSATHLGIATLLAVILGVVMSGRRWRTPALVLVLGGAQAAFHLVLRGEHAHGMAGMGQASSSALPMLLAHLAAALVSAGVLAHGDLRCERLLHLLSRPVRRVELPSVPVLVDLRAPGRSTRLGMRRQCWVESLQRRGPPAVRVS